MRRPLRLPLLALICLAAVLLAACGSSGDKRSSADTEKLVNDTFGNTTPVTSGRLKLGIDVRADGLAGVPSPLSVRLGGPFQRTTAGGAPKFAFDISLATRDGRFTVGIISTGKQGWIKLNQRAFTLPPAQLKQLAGGAGSTGGLPGDLGKLGVDPRLWISNVQDEGVETLDGAKVVHLTADVDIPGLVKDLDKLLSSAGGTGLNAIAGLPTGIGKDKGAVAKAVKSAHVDIWTGEKDHDLRRITIRLTVDTPTQKDGTVALDLGVAGLNEAQPIGPPANPRPLSELSAALAVLSRATSQAQSGSASGTPGATGSSGTGTAPAQGYDACVQAAGSDLSKAQSCADLLD